MNNFGKTLCYMILIMTVILMFIILDRKINNQTDLLIRLTNEGFTTSASAFNQAAAYTTGDNYMMSSDWNKKYKQKSAAFIPDNNSGRSLHPMNGIMANKMLIPDENSLTGYYPSIGFPSTSINSVNNYVEGANVRNDRVKHTENLPIETQNNHVAIIEQNDEDTNVEQYSVNPKKYASAARQFIIPSKNKSAAKIRQSFSKPMKRIGKI